MPHSPPVPDLPVIPLLPRLQASLRNEPNLVLQAPPGAGKTTCVPAALLELTSQQIVVLEPRRLAARLAARHVAAIHGEPLGKTIGYQVRFEQAASRATRILYVTEGVLARRLAGGDSLLDTGIVILDEFHERHLEGDLALALLRRLQTTTRPDLRLIVMSATLDTGPLAAFLGGCPVVRSEGRLYETAIRFTPVSADPLDRQVASALRALVSEGLDGHVLVFLPGAAEIRRAERACRPIADRANLLLVPLHGDLSVEEQERALSPSPNWKVILSTNVAESSVTIDGVSAVIDSGLARIVEHSPWSGLESLRIARISRFSAEQRAGRAARQRPGRVIRLYPQEDFLRRPEQTAPAIEREDLAPVALDLASLGLTPERVSWLEPPPGEAYRAACQLLARLGAVDATGRITPRGRKMASYPLPPRLAALLVEGKARGVFSACAAIAALLSAGERLPASPHPPGDSDLLVLIEADWSYRARQVFRQLAGSAKLSPDRREEDLLLAVLAAFPDRVARRVREGELLLAGGRAARLAAESVVRHAPFLVCVEAEDRPDQPAPLVRLASAVKPEWLLDLFPERITERETLEWNAAAGRVESVSAMYFEDLLLTESRTPPRDSQGAARLLAEKAWELGIERLVDPEPLQQFLSRCWFLAGQGRLPPVTGALLQEALYLLSAGKRSLAELRQDCAAGFLPALLRCLPPGAHSLLESQAPARWRLPSGRSAPITYPPGQPPFLAAPLQEFFGAAQGPSLAGGAVKLVLHLLAPNRRPVQVTTDLAGFWERHYPQLRKELARRYPKHSWPDDPLRAAPPPLRRPKPPK